MSDSGHCKYSRMGKKSKPGLGSTGVGVLLSGCTSAPQAQRGQAGSEPMLIGWVDRAALDHPGLAGFKISCDTAQVQKGLVERVHQAREAADWLVFFGSWCGDSRREVPKFLKVTDLAGIPQERILLYRLDRSKQSPDGLAEKCRIERVPTVVAFAHGQEIGRITETPLVSMEADMLSILARTR